MWLFDESVQARRDSVIRTAGTYEMKSLPVTKDVNRALLIGKMLVANAGVAFYDYPFEQVYRIILTLLGA
ncbi:hypothetical protein H310_03374 [Aphanomyces invadans]|uniref:Uncharacterized protein n=1 Tax=Aphanomyces invadans TaxID=157072 RepID=A0A024UH74_9STRA|nr:hypothetical protein H310_03374 [Aphanomyces invadans]ETW05649.1 hypothetical protein H310_03374 [Aphanomyces invadans]|eukprot:XP_008865426.1 hypothetical protein H310_03374 [Aphanomyces invadans]